MLFQSKAFAFLCVFFMLLLLTTNAFADVHALLIGIGNYRNAGSEFQRLYGPSNDVEMMEDLLRRNFQVNRITVLKDSSATRQNILNELNKIKNNTTSKDIVFFYYSGHGTQIKDMNGDEKDDGMDEAIVAYDHELNTPKGLVIDDELYGVFKEMQDRLVLVVMDSCHSGTVTKSLQNKKYTPKYIDPILNFNPAFYPALNPKLGDETLPDNHLLLGAAQDTQKALEKFSDLDRQYHGLFTVHLVRGLKGDADSNHDGSITYREIYDYVRTAVNTENSYQTPAVYTKEERILNQTFWGKKPQSITQYSIQSPDKIKIKLEGIGQGDILYTFKGIKAEFVEGKWDFLIRKTGSKYELYGKTGDFIEEDVSINKILKRIDALTLTNAFIGLKNQKQNFNITVDAGKIGGYYFKEGDTIRYTITSEADSYLLWMNIDEGGYVTVLLPNKRKGGDDNLLRKGIRYNIPRDEHQDFDFKVIEPFGKEAFKLIALKSKDYEGLFGKCLNNSTNAHEYELGVGAGCDSWEFYKRLKRILEQSSDWAETSIEIETGR